MATTPASVGGGGDREGKSARGNNITELFSLMRATAIVSNFREFRTL